MYKFNDNKYVVIMIICRIVFFYLMKSPYSNATIVEGVAGGCSPSLPIGKIWTPERGIVSMPLCGAHVADISGTTRTSRRVNQLWKRA